MKGRSGFVSNSSTASFVLLGFNASWLDIERPWEYECLQGEEGECPTGVKLVIGKFLYRCSSDSYAEPIEESLEVYVRQVAALRKKLGADTDIKLWSGMMAC